MQGDTTKKKRERVQRVSDWDDARWSNSAARAADDLRLTAIHFRLLAYLGRVNSSYGWCELSQKAVAARWGLARTSVNEAVGELVEWGYVEKRGQERTKTALCQYRVLIDNPAAETDDGTEDDSSAADVSATADTPPGGDVSAIGDTRVGQHPTHVSAIRTHLLDQRSKTSPLTPQAGDQGSDGFSGSDAAAASSPPDSDSVSARAGDALRKLAADRPHDAVVTRLLTPLLAKRRFSASDPAAALAQACARAKALPGPHLDKVLEILLAAELKVIKAERVFAAIEAVRTGGLMLVIGRGQPEFAAWLRHFEQTKPNIAALMARGDKWQVPARWPPGQTLPHAADGGSGGARESAGRLAPGPAAQEGNTP